MPRLQRVGVGPGRLSCLTSGRGHAAHIISYIRNSRGKRRLSSRFACQLPGIVANAHQSLATASPFRSTRICAACPSAAIRCCSDWSSSGISSIGPGQSGSHVGARRAPRLPRTGGLGLLKRLDGRGAIGGRFRCRR